MLQSTAYQHTAAQEHNLAVRILRTERIIEIAVRILQHRLVVRIGADIVRTQVHTHHIRRITGEIPFHRIHPEERLVVHPRHTVGIPRLRTAVVAIDTDTATRHHHMLRLQGTGGQCRIRIIMVFGFIREAFLLIHGLYPITTSHGIADKLNLPFRQVRRSQQLASGIQSEATEFRYTLVTFDGIHDAYFVILVTKRRSQCHHRIFRSVEAHLERLTAVYLHHEIPTHRLGFHFQRSPLKACIDLYPRIRERRSIRVLEVDTTHILDIFITRFNPSSVRWKLCSYTTYQAQQRNHQKTFQSIHRM